jgi:hypothetical protein
VYFSAHAIPPALMPGGGAPPCCVTKVQMRNHDGVAWAHVGPRWDDCDIRIFGVRDGVFAKGGRLSLAVTAWSIRNDGKEMRAG